MPSRGPSAGAPRNIQPWKGKKGGGLVPGTKPGKGGLPPKKKKG